MDSQEKEAALSLLRKFVGINTSNPPGCELKLALLIQQYLAGSKAEVQIISCGDGRGSVVAKLSGTGQARPIVLNGHMDTVPFGNLENWKSRPDELFIDGNRAYGRGTADMKSGLAAMVYAFKKAALQTELPKGDIYLAATSDEEAGGTGAEVICDLLPLKEGIIYISEPTNNGIGVRAKGTLWVTLDIQGKTAHGAYPERGINAIDIAWLMYQDIKSHLSSFEDPLLGISTCTATEISGGVKTNMVADTCKLTMDIRTVPSKTANEDCIQFLENLAYKYMAKFKGLTISCQILNNRQAVLVSDIEEGVTNLASIVEGVSGQNPLKKGIKFFSDASIFVKKEPEAICILFGPGNEECAHIPNEYVELDKYFTSVVCYNKLLDYYWD